MNTSSYRVFLTISQYKSFIKAAEIHNLTPPAITHIVKEMEKEFGFPLFKRNKSGVTLTSLGENIYQYIKEIVDKEDSLQQFVQSVNGLAVGKIKMGIFNSMTHYLVEIINEFHKTYPLIEFEIYQGSYEDIIKWLKEGTVDIGFLSKTVNKDFVFNKICSDPLMCVVSTSTPTSSETEINVEELAAMPCIMQRESCDSDAQLLMSEFNLSSKSKCHVIDDLSTINMVKAGFGYAIMPLLTMKDLKDGVKTLKILPERKRTIGVVVKDEKNLSPAMNTVYSFIKNYKFV